MPNHSDPARTIAALAVAWHDAQHGVKAAAAAIDAAQGEGAVDAEHPTVYAWSRACDRANDARRALLAALAALSEAERRELRGGSDAD